MGSLVFHHCCEMREAVARLGITNPSAGVLHATTKKPNLLDVR
jgi:hypothetical protein